LTAASDLNLAGSDSSKTLDRAKPTWHLAGHLHAVALPTSADIPHRLALP